ncbi:MAG: hypothetical protein WC645_08305 [Candidatus Margulisiibacteriota bacterium]
MASLAITLKATKDSARKILIEMDADKFERLAASLGLFNPAFLKSVDKAEKDYRAGKFKRIGSLKELRK